MHAELPTTLVHTRISLTQVPSTRPSVSNHVNHPHSVLPFALEVEYHESTTNPGVASTETKPMTVIADITVPANTFALGRVLDDIPDIEIELERIVPLQEAIIPLFWISGGDPEAIKARLHDHPQTETVAELTTTDDETLFEVHWSPDIDGIIQALIDTRAKILEATGTADTWDFRLRFTAHEDLSAFNMALTEDDIPVTLRHIYNPTLPEEKSALSSDQRETLLTAYRHGYFKVPRGTTLHDLAEAEEISDSALSQRIRHGVDALIEETLLADDQPSR
jgi:predicted DNA binding protein